MDIRSRHPTSKGRGRTPTCRYTARQWASKAPRQWESGPNPFLRPRCAEKNAARHAQGPSPASTQQGSNEAPGVAFSARPADPPAAPCPSYSSTFAPTPPAQAPSALLGAWGGRWVKRYNAPKPECLCGCLNEKYCVCFLGDVCRLS